MYFCASPIHYKVHLDMAPTFLLLYAITNEKIGSQPKPSLPHRNRFNNSGRYIPYLSLIYLVLYTSELFSIVDNKLIGYADDCTLIAVVP